MELSNSNDFNELTNAKRFVRLILIFDVQVWALGVCSGV
jgi:hypothetical protein